MVAHNDAVFRAASEATREIFGNETNTAGQPGGEKSKTKVNVGGLERNLSLAAGAVLGFAALTKPLSLRGLVLAGLGGALIYRGVSGNCGLYRALGINTSRKADEPSADAEQYSESGIHIEESVTIDKPASDLFTHWRTLSNLPGIMNYLKEVRVLDNKRSHWSVKAPLGFAVEWDAEIINEEQGKLIAWRSIGEAMASNSGSVRFLENESRQTEVRVVLDYLPPAGQVGAMVVRLFGEDPAQQIRQDLERFKAKMEESNAPAASRLAEM